MAHTDAGHYAAKHGAGESPNGRIVEALGGRIREGICNCAEAERVGKALDLPLAEVGRTLDLIEVRIGHCQLGLFGYGDTGQPNGKTVQAASAVDPQLERAIRDALVEGRLSCREAWTIAEKTKHPRMAVSSACETLKIRIKFCQLGAF